MQARKIDYNQLSPFELKDSLIAWAKESAKKSSRVMLDAGRGNPNWIATTPREAFFLLGQFGLEESKRVWSEKDLGGMPAREGIARRFDEFLDRYQGLPGAELLRRALAYSVSELKVDPESFVHELVDSIVGDNYPVPDRMLRNAEQVVHRYLVREMCDDRPPPGRYDLFAVEGGTAAMCYIFNSLVTNKILAPGDTIALGTPIFTPYLEIPELSDFRFHTVKIDASEIVDGRHTWQYPESELRKLEDPKIKAFFIVNPSNPGSVAMNKRSVDQLVKIVREKRPDLLILTDDVYGTFVPGFRSLAAELPRNTLLVYSYSKHFGCTGWRLGVIALHEDNIIDERIARLPEADRKELHERYRSVWLEPDKTRFIDRMVADSRNVALNHTAGLSLPQQVQMTLFSLFALVDPTGGYKKRVREIVHERRKKLFEGLAIPHIDDPLGSYYYIDLDIANWAHHAIGPEFGEYIRTHHAPLDIVFALAKRHGTVLLNGGGFDAPPWSARVSLANLDEDDYEQIGKNLLEVVRGAIEQWKMSEKKAA